MKIYTKAIALSSLSMLMIIGSYKIFFSEKTDIVSDVFLPIENTEEDSTTTEEKIDYQEDSLVASAKEDTVSFKLY